jgi:hypothetical protein
VVWKTRQRKGCITETRQEGGYSRYGERSRKRERNENETLVRWIQLGVGRVKMLK